MVQWLMTAAARDALAETKAIHRSFALVEFALDGTIITANDNFLTTKGYSLAEVTGKHHSMFVAPGMRDSTDYKRFWETLQKGEYHSGEFKRIGKGQREIWIHGSYNPIFDASGKAIRIVKFCSDVSAAKLRSLEDRGMIAAIGRSQAVIEFNLDGTIVSANPNFLEVMGYSLDEVRGKHHSMFVTPAERSSDAYSAFWASLNRGEYQSAEYKRIGKGGKEVWILATYNPILDEDGKPIK